MNDADAIRSKLIKNICDDQIPGIAESEKRKKLQFVVVGGGPTGVEFSGELSNLVKEGKCFQLLTYASFTNLFFSFSFFSFSSEDLMKMAPGVSSSIQITIIEARDILGSFNPDLRLYAENILNKSGVQIVKAMVKEVTSTSVVLSDGSELDYGLLVWSTGVGPTPFINSLPFAKARDGRLEVSVSNF